MKQKIRVLACNHIATLVLLMSAIGLTPNPAMAQALTLAGSVTNLGWASSPLDVGLSASFEWRVTPANIARGEIVIGEPLGGSGRAFAAMWPDTVLLLSTSPAGDTIAWLGRMGEAAVSGEYVILGGQWTGQGGVWSISGTGLSRLPIGRNPDSEFVAAIVDATVGLRTRDRRAARPVAPQLADTTEWSSWSEFLYLLVAAAVLMITALAARLLVGRAKRRAAEESAKPGQYSVRCPTCNARPLAQARALWQMRGLVLVVQYGERTLIGCRYCVYEEGLRLLAVNLVAGWWCFPWGFLTPVVAAQNVLALILPSSRSTLDNALRRAGIRPEDVLLDRDGLTLDQRELIETACFVLTTMMWADGQAHPIEEARALHILGQLTDGRLFGSRAKSFLKMGRMGARKFDRLSVEVRHTLLAVALDIALSDGSLALNEIATLHSLAAQLGFGAQVVEALLDEATGRTRARDSSDSKRRTRSHRTGTDLQRAWDVLGLRVGSSLMDAKRAWRSAMVKFHPDRAGPDKAKQADHTRRSQEINWAYTTVRSRLGEIS